MDDATAEGRMDGASDERHSFVIRIWRHENDAGWQGWVQHEPSGRSAVSQALHQLLALIEGWLVGSTNCRRQGLR